jgi:tetratricopeptide (TPR) repeat protein
MSEVPGVRNVADGVSARSIVQARDIAHLGIHLDGSGPARSRYREQVREIAPATLIGRDAELAVLAEFCTGDDTGRSYLWVRGAKWVGKSALMSWFVLHPPVNTRIVSFFVTARYGDQDHRGAFLDVVMEQLADLLDEPAPLALGEANRESHFRGLLADAAERCRANGERLVLLVDGLDEDRGWRPGGGSALSHSIAALLPARPPACLRVVVSGRPNPPLPADVRPDHPLRDPGIVHPLAQSSAARVIQDDMELELARLLDGTEAEQDLLGLTVAAAGGLSAADLAELTELAKGAVSRLLRTVATRSFDVRPSRWQPGLRPDVYLLGHEELQVTAREHIGGTRLDRYRERLHTWADRYRAAGWPPDTPEYLLRGYFRMLVAIGDLTRMVVLTADPARHDRMSAVAGGDFPGLAELDIVRNVLAERHDRATLVHAARYAVHRDRLEYRNGTMPPDLAGVWAALGHAVRAESMARTLYGEEERAQALVAVAGTSARAGDLARAQHLVDSITEPAARLAGIAEVVAAYVARGDRESALSLMVPARKLLDATAQHRWGRALAAYLRALVEIGDLDEAMTRYESAGGGRALREATPAMVDALLAAGVPERAAAVVDAIEEVGQAATAYLSLAEAWFAAGERGRGDAAVADARRVIDTIKGELRRRSITMPLVRVLARAGDVTAATALATAWDEPEWLAEGCTHLAAVCAPEDARKWLREAESAAVRIYAGGGWRANALTSLAVVAAERGAVDDAVRIASAVTEAPRRAVAFARLARTLVAVGRTEEATSLATEAESVARSQGGTDHKDAQARALTGALADLGEFDRAATMLTTIVGDYHRDLACLDIVEALVRAGQLTRAAAVAAPITASDVLRKATAMIAGGWVAAGKYQVAEDVVRLRSDDRLTAQLALIFAGAGKLGRAVRLTRRFEPGLRAETLVDLAGRAREAGEHRLADWLADEAVSLCAELAADLSWDSSLNTVVRMFRRQGDEARVERIALAHPVHYDVLRYPFLEASLTDDVDDVDEPEPFAAPQAPTEEEARDLLLAGRWVSALPAASADRAVFFTVVEEFERLLAHRD